MNPKQVAQFSVNFWQVLNEHGELTQDLPEFAKDIHNLTALYESMVQIRVFDTKAIALQRTGKMGTYPSILGQEAISTVIGKILLKEDVFCPNYRDCAAQILRGVGMDEIFAYWGGDERGSCYRNNAQDLPICVPIASQCLHAVGIAYAFKLRNERRVALTTIGDGGTSEGDFYEALNAAGVWHLPLVFVINNNRFAISVPVSLQTGAETLAQKAIAGGIACEQVDGNDIIALYDRIQYAVKYAREKQEPYVIEALTYRLSDHTTADDASRYRSQEDWLKAKQAEPVARLKAYLEKQNAWNSDKEEKLQAQAKELVEKAVQDYLSRPPQKLESIFDYHYAQLPKSLDEQKQEALFELSE